jgi:ketosteroid isomerase-like protein
VARIVEFFESITPADAKRLGEFYAAEASFKDPFNDVRGVPAIEQVFAHMFVALDEPRFVVHHIVVQGDECFLTWDFLFRFRRLRSGPQVVRGATHLRFGTDGRITLHRDYWDAAEELYEKLPLVGALMRFLKRRAAT